MKNQENKNTNRFEKLSEKFYYQNFGRATKQEIDQMMFNFYYEDHREESEVEIARKLGITPNKVRNLITKYYLTYEIVDIDLEKEIKKIINSNDIFFVDNRIIMNINNPMLYYELEDYLEHNGGYVEKVLNSKIFQITLPNFCKLINNALDDESKDEIRKIIASNNKYDKSVVPKDFAEMLETACKVTGLISNIKSLLPTPLSLVATFVNEVITR